MNAITGFNSSPRLLGLPFVARMLSRKRPVAPHALDFDYIGAVNSFFKSAGAGISERILQFRADLAGNPQLAEQIYQIVNRRVRP